MRLPVMFENLGLALAATFVILQVIIQRSKNLSR